MESAASGFPGPGDAVLDADDMSVEEIEAAIALTQAAVQRALHGRLAAVQPAATSTPTFIKYDPARNHPGAFDSGRIVRLSEMPFDPLAPPKFRRRRVPRRVGSPPVPVRSSPPRPPSRRDQDDWKVPPCVSRWNNPRGYMMPLDKRQRAALEVRISDNFARLAEAIYAAEVKAREAVRTRSAVQKELRAKEVDRRERELRRLAASARKERAAVAHAAAAPGAPAVSAGEEPRVDEKRKAKQSVSDTGGAKADEQQEKVAKKDEGPSGAPAAAAGKRERPDGFDEPEQGDHDPFDLDEFMAQVKKGKED